VARILRLVCGRLNHRLRRLGFIGGDCPTPHGTTPVMIGQRIAHDPAQPGIYPGVVRNVGSPDYLEAKILESILSILGSVQAPSKEAHQVGSALN
jgi:hypothetical protein